MGIARNATIAAIRAIFMMDTSFRRTRSQLLDFFRLVAMEQRTASD